MTAEQLLRDQLDRATSDVPGSPDLETSVRQGRRRRRRRRGGVLALAAVAVVGLGALAVSTGTDGGDATTVAQDPPAAGAPAPADFVPGTDIDTTMADAIAEHLPSLPAPDDVYPSDSHTAGPLPDQEFASAEDWQAAYTLSGSEFLVIAAAPSEGGFTCPDCAKEKVPGGTLYRQTFTSGEPDQWYFGVYFVRPDGSTVNAFESLTALDVATAKAQRQLKDPDLEELVQDQRLAFPRV